MPPRGKFSKPSRGGGKKFSRDVQPTDKYGNPVGLWRDPADDPSSSSDDESEETSSEEESSAEEGAGEGSSKAAGGSKGEEGETGEAEMTREERRAAARAKKQTAMAKRRQQAAQPGDLPPSESEGEDDGVDEDGELPANPNHTAKARSQTQAQTDKPTTGGSGKEKVNGDLSQLTRREREAIEAQQQRERYLKLHAEGKTEEARSDLARLAIVREQREAERARKEAEKEEKAEAAKERVKEREAREAARGKKGKGKK